MKIVKYWIVVFILSLTTSSCSSLMQLNIFPISKDIELGKRFDEEIRRNPKEYPILKNKPEVKLFIENIGKKILLSPEIKYRNQFAYQFEVIDDDSTVNAFCTPGGYIYVYTGLLKFVDNEATLASVIAHEIAHAERRHATNKITAAYGIQIAIGLASGKLGETGTQVANIAASLGLLKFSRDDEIEADTYAFKYLRSTEYFPGALIYFFEKVGVGRKGNAFEKLLSTHPLPQERVDHMKKMISDAGISQANESNLFTDRYNNFKKNILTNK